MPELTLANADELVGWSGEGEKEWVVMDDKMYSTTDDPPVLVTVMERQEPRGWLQSRERLAYPCVCEEDGSERLIVFADRETAPLSARSGGVGRTTKDG